MYEHYFNFSEKPFSLLPDPDFLYLGEQHKMALHMLRYGVTNQAGFIVVTGEVGCGKTILVRQLLNELEQDTSIGLISDTHHNQDEILQRVLMAFDLEFADANRTVLYSRLVNFLVAEYSKNRRVVLIVDEAQNMSRQNLEELRTLSNVNADKDQLIQLMLLGQPELRETLRQRDMRQFVQRISVDYHLEPLTKQQTGDYIRYRLQVAGGDPGLFSAGACAVIYRNSGGVPRLINRLCDTALLYAYGAYQTRIDRDLVSKVASDIGKGGLSGLHDFPTSIIDHSSSSAPEDAEDEDDDPSDGSMSPQDDVSENPKLTSLVRDVKSEEFSQSVGGPGIRGELMVTEMPAGLRTSQSPETLAASVLSTGTSPTMRSSAGHKISPAHQHKLNSNDQPGHGEASRWARPQETPVPLRLATLVAKPDHSPTYAVRAPVVEDAEPGVSEAGDSHQSSSSGLWIGVSITLFVIGFLALVFYERTIRPAPETVAQSAAVQSDDAQQGARQSIGAIDTSTEAEQARQLYTRAQDHYRTGDLKAALESAERGLALAPTSSELADLRAQIEQRLRQQEQQLARKNKRAREVAALVSVARELHHAGDLVGARAAVDRGLAIEPDNAELMNLDRQLSAALQEQARAAEAARRIQVEVAQFVEKARAEHQRGQIGEAFLSVRQGLAIAPTDATLVELGASLQASIRERKRQQDEEARRAREVATLVVAANERSESGDYEEARAAVDRGLAIEPNNAELLPLGEQIDAAIAEQKRSAAEAERRRQATTRHIQQARAQQERGEIKQALASVRQGKALEPENQELSILEAQLSAELVELKRLEAAQTRQKRQLGTPTEDMSRPDATFQSSQAQPFVNAALQHSPGTTRLKATEWETEADPAHRQPSGAAQQYIAKGNRYLELGDVASARLFYEAAAATGSAQAMVLVGVTYDPITARQRGLRVHTDPVSAVTWYRTALGTGAASEARQRLRLLATWCQLNQEMLSNKQKAELADLLAQ